MSQQKTNFNLLTVVSELLNVPVELLKPDVNLIELGLDSISMMRLTGQLRNAGFNISFAQLIGTPTLASWQKIISSNRL